MIIETVKLKNFRCFKEGYFELDPSCTVILGKNGSGKSSLLEALHYSCYLRSFRTHHNEELIFRDEKIEAGADHFFIEIAGEQKIKASFSLTGGKLVSYDSKKVQSYKELFSFHKVITVTSQDSELIQGAPEKRREFMNYALFLKKPDFFHYFQRYKNDLAQRNALLQRAYYEPYITKRDEFVLWSKQLWEGSLRIHKER